MAMIQLERIKTKVGRIFLEKNKEKKVRIYSDQWGSYWRSNRCGYTDKKEEAGIYTFEDAFDASGHCGPEKHILYEFVK